MIFFMATARKKKEKKEKIRNKDQTVLQESNADTLYFRESQEKLLIFFK